MSEPRLVFNSNILKPGMPIHISGHDEEFFKVDGYVLIKSVEPDELIYTNHTGCEGMIYIGSVEHGDISILLPGKLGAFSVNKRILKAMNEPAKKGGLPIRHVPEQ